MISVNQKSSPVQNSFKWLKDVDCLQLVGLRRKIFKNLLNTWNMVKYRIYSSWILASKSIFSSKENDWTTNPNRYLYNWDCFGSSSDSIPNRQLGQTQLLEMLRKWTIQIHLYPTKLTTKKIHIDQSCQLSIACWSRCKTNHEPCLWVHKRKVILIKYIQNLCAVYTQITSYYWKKLHFWQAHMARKQMVLDFLATESCEERESPKNHNVMLISWQNLHKSVQFIKRQTEDLSMIELKSNSNSVHWAKGQVKS